MEPEYEYAVLLGGHVWYGPFWGTQGLRMCEAWKNDINRSEPGWYIARRPCPEEWERLNGE